LREMWCLRYAPMICLLSKLFALFISTFLVSHLGEAVGGNHNTVMHMQLQLLVSTCVWPARPPRLTYVCRREVQQQSQNDCNVQWIKRYMSRFLLRRHFYADITIPFFNKSRSAQGCIGLFVIWFGKHGETDFFQLTSLHINMPYQMFMANFIWSPILKT
jgi:hypothetical protein